MKSLGLSVKPATAATMDHYYPHPYQQELEEFEVCCLGGNPALLFTCSTSTCLFSFFFPGLQPPKEQLSTRQEQLYRPLDHVSCTWIETPAQLQVRWCSCLSMPSDCCPICCSGSWMAVTRLSCSRQFISLHPFVRLDIGLDGSTIGCERAGD